MKAFSAILTAIIFFGWGEKPKEPETKIQTSETMTQNKTPRVTGMGGIFFKCREPEKCGNGTTSTSGW